MTSVERSKPAVSEAAHLRADAAPPDAAASTQSNAHDCGLVRPKHIDLIPMVRNRLIVSRTLRATRLTGVPKLMVEPDDFESYYLAENSFEPASLPAQVVGLRGAAVSFVNAPDCHAKVGKLSAWAWADGQGTGWRLGNPTFNAARAFRDGDSFLIADLEMDCREKRVAGATGNLPAFFHAWQVRDLSGQEKSEENIRLMQKGLAALESAQALAPSNAAYERFRKEAQGLPERWWFLPRTYARWSLATDGDAALLIVELRGREILAQQEFAAAWLGIWCIGSGGRIEPLGVDYLPHELADTVTSHRNRLQVAGAPDELPLILYSHYSLQADTGRYRTYDYALPAPVQLD